MFNIIPIQFYSLVYFIILLIVVFFTFLNSFQSNLTASENLKNKKQSTAFLLIFTILYMGLRPISGVFFGDMGTYATHFENYQQGLVYEIKGDLVFENFTQFCSKIMNVNSFFLLCAILYVLPLYTASIKWFKVYGFYAFLAIVCSFSFWSFGTNGIRNGIATSIFLYALSRDKLVFKIVFIVLAIGFHKSLVIPTAALALTYFYKNPKLYFYGWLLCIPLSLVAGGFWESLFSGFMADERSSYLTDGNINDDQFSSTGFRWDFVIYSAAAVYSAYFFIFKKKFSNATYNRLVAVYLTANGFWILVIRANFSNRFAYLSWFMMAIIIVFPFLTKIQVKNQHKILGMVLMAYFGFTFLMNVILAS